MNRQGRGGACPARAQSSRGAALPCGVRAKKFAALALAALALLCGAGRGEAATLPAGFAETQVAAGLGSPTAMAFAPDGRAFVCLQGGSLRVVKNGSLLPTPFLTVTVNASGERGLLGLAFDPNFGSNRFLYVYYTATTPAIHNRVSRFTASASNPDVAEAGSEVVLLELENLSGATNHNGGAMHFGADGKLYVATGENANPAHAQSYANKLGKILRINTDPADLIPPDNPFVSRATGTNRAIWALGLRNPYTFAVQPGTGRIFINDVGQAAWEEINDGAAGANYGWPSCEGVCPNPAPTPAIRPPNTFTNPVFQYGHGGPAPAGCAITGGTFYNPETAQFPANYVGKYFFADFCTNFIRYVDPASPATSVPFATNLSSPVDLQVSADGSLWYLERGNTGRLMRVRHTSGSQPPAINGHPQSQTVAAGSPATFTVSASGSGTLLYQWQRNNADIPGATAQSYTLNPATAADNNAQFRAVVTNPFGSATSNSAALTVTGNTPPVASISSPAAGTTYAAGDTINYSGSATDAQDGTLQAAAFTWQVDFHHDTHAHPFVAPTTGAASGSFTIPTTGETAANVWYRIYLTVTDSAGAQHQTFRDVVPRTSTLTLRTNPAGLQLALDGQPRADGYAELNVVGMQRALTAPLSQVSGGVTYNFLSWSDGGAAAHNVSVPATATTYTATYARRADAGEVVISEFRLDGPAGATDEFVELYNRTDRDITVSAADGSAGWALVTARGDVRVGPRFPSISHVIPAGTIIPARARYLIVGTQYSLSNYGGLNAARGDAVSTDDLRGDNGGEPFGGLGLFRTANPSAFVAENRLDAVGCAGLSLPLLVEGNGAPGPCHNVGTPAQPAANYSLVRRPASGVPQDTNDNAADFQLVAVESPLQTPGGVVSPTWPAALGAPGPENLSSPLERSSKIKATLIAPRAAPSEAPNRVRDTTPIVGGAEGTLSIRRKFTNRTGAAITRLRFRVAQLSTLGNRSDAEADLRLLSSGDIVVHVGGVPFDVRGTTLEVPPAQGNGGGLNSTLSAGTVTLGAPLPPGQSIRVQFLLGVRAGGKFRFLVNVEALP